MSPADPRKATPAQNSHAGGAVRARAESSPVYAGMWIDDQPCVTVSRDGQTVPLRFPGAPESSPPFGFAWGYAGPAPARLALTILADLLDAEPDGVEIALCVHDSLHRLVIAGLPEAWVLSAEQISEFLAILQL